MPDSREELIAELGMQAPRAAFQLGRYTWMWMLVTVVYVLAATFATGPVRPGAAAAIFLNPQFTIEIVLGGFCFASAALLAFKLAVPGASSFRHFVLAWSSLGLWLLLLALAFVAPAFEPSMLGKRDHCVIEAFVYSVPPAAAGLWLLTRGYVLAPWRAAMALGVAAGLLPVVVMQVACMYEASHTFIYHVGPGAVTGLVTGVAGLVLLKKPGRISA